MIVRKVLALLVLSSLLLIGSPAYAAPEKAVVRLDKNATLAQGGPQFVVCWRACLY